MEIFLICLAALLPPLALWFYIWRKDSLKPEPISQHLKALALGAIACIPVVFIEIVVDRAVFPLGEPTTFLGIVIDSFFIIALIEEAVKLLALWIVVHSNKYFDEHFDGIVYAVCVGLGFAAVENLIYLISNSDNWQLLAVGRALISVPGHYAFAVLMGYYYSLNHFVLRSTRYKAYILVIPVLAHGVFNTLVLVGKVAPEVYGIAFVVLIFFCIRLQTISRKRIISLLDKDKDD